MSIYQSELDLRCFPVPDTKKWKLINNVPAIVLNEQKEPSLQMIEKQLIIFKDYNQSVRVAQSMIKKEKELKENGRIHLRQGR